MPYDGFGNFTRDYDFTADKLANIKIQSVRVDGECDNFADAFNQVVLRNGVVPMAGNLKLGNNSIIGIGAASEATPSISFSGDVSTGMFQPAPATIGFAVSGAEVTRLLGTGLQVTGLLSFPGDPTSGYGSPGAGLLTTTIAGAELGRWTATGLGLGTTTPRSKLDVAGIMSQRGAFEDCVIAAGALTGTVNIDYISAAVYILTTNAVGNWIFNIRGDGTPTTLDSLMTIGQMLSLAVEVPQGAAPFYCTAITIDGAAPASLKWQGGAPAAGNASGLDIYLIRVVKTAAATFQVRASLSQEK